jgi:hypothetical protein
MVEAPRPVVYIYAMLLDFSTPAPFPKGYHRGLPNHTTSLSQAEYATGYVENRKEERKKPPKLEIPYQLV